MTQGNRTPIKQQNRTGQKTISAPKPLRPDFYETLDDDRIDWERKQKGKKVVAPIEEEVEDLLIEDSVAELVVQPPKVKKHHKKKHREIIYDDERDQVLVKRKRRRQSAQAYGYFDEFD
jgi:hypothetical protein